MKKLVLKKWVEVVLGIIWVCLVMLLASEYTQPVMYLLTIILFVLVSAVLIKYGKDYE